jgi:ecdysone 20-monooxygenase
MSVADMFRKYGSIVRERALWNFPVVSLLERRDIEVVLKHQSKFPLRPPTEVLAWYRQSRPDRYTTLGLINEYVQASSTPAFTVTGFEYFC